MLFAKLTAIIATACVVFSPVAAKPTLTPRAAESTNDLGTQLAQSNHYGAPIPPWEVGHQPGWYYGDQPSLLSVLGLGSLPWLKDSLICLVLDLLPLCLHCPHKPPHPPPNDGWKQVFSNLTGAIQGDDYLTFGLVDTVDDCKTMCEDVDTCVFFNTYHDVNGKDGSPLLTCALFSGCHTAADATNTGGQSQPDGSIDFITNSDGFCHV